jgi:hypothetical protein
MSPGLVLTTRVLARHLIEAGLLVPHVDEPPPRWAVGVDALRGLSMLGVALSAARFRAPALASAGVASGLAALAAHER